MKIARRSALLSALAVPAGLAAALAPPRALAEDAQSLLARIAKARSNLLTLQGPFTQTRTIALLATDVRSTGTLTLVRPDRLRWELAPPDAVTFWVTPEGLAYRSTSGSGRVPATTQSTSAILEDLGSLLGGDPQTLLRRWSLRVLRDDAEGTAVEALPRTGSPAGLRRMQLTLAPDLARPTEVTLDQGPRDHTLIKFGDLRINTPVDPALMRPV
jgi:outer membrane lipoprotein-sorting protein